MIVLIALGLAVVAFAIIGRKNEAPTSPDAPEPGTEG